MQKAGFLTTWLILPSETLGKIKHYCQQDLSKTIGAWGFEDKEVLMSLFETDNISSVYIINILELTDTLPAFLYHLGTTLLLHYPFAAKVSKAAASTIFIPFGMA